MQNPLNLDDYKQQVATYFNSRTTYDSSEFAQIRVQSLLKLVQFQKGQKILDVGIGTGLAAIEAAEKVGASGKIVGVDISTGMLNQLRSKIETAELKNIEIIEADAEYINFPDESFDGILCCSTIMVFSDIPAILRGWHCFLKHGGFVAFNAYSENAFLTPEILAACAKYEISLPNLHYLLGTPERCEQLLIEAGFEDITVKTEQFGKYISIDDGKKNWNGTWFHPQNPLPQLDKEEIAKLTTEYAKNIEAIATDLGVWWDATTFFVLARK